MVKGAYMNLNSQRRQRTAALAASTLEFTRHKAYVYVLYDTRDNVSKVGRSVEPLRRYRKLLWHNEYLTFFYAWPVEDVSVALWVETRVKRILRPFRHTRNAETFNVTPQELLDCVKLQHMMLKKFSSRYEAGAT